MSRPSAGSANDRPTMGMARRSPSFSIKSNRSTSSIISAATAQRIKSFSEYIQLFCSLTDGKLDFQEVESIILQPIFIDTELLQQMCPLVTTFANILRMAQTEPQDWFDFIAHRKGNNQNADVMMIDINEFISELSKLCGEVGFPLLAKEDMIKLFNFINGDRPENGFTLFNLAVAFAKYRLSPAKVRAVNIVASQLQNLGVFLTESHLSLKILGELSVSSLKSGLITFSELSVMFTNLLIRKDASDENDAISSVHSNDSPSVPNSGTNVTCAKYITAPLVAASSVDEEGDAAPFVVDGTSNPHNNSTIANVKAAGICDNNPHNASILLKDQFNNKKTDGNKTNATISSTVEVAQEYPHVHVTATDGMNDNKVTQYPPARHNPKKRKSFLENFTEAVFSAIQFTGSSNTSSKKHRTNFQDDNNNNISISDTNNSNNNHSSQPKRGSFFNLKRSSAIAPTSSHEEAYHQHYLEHPLKQNTSHKGHNNNQHLQENLAKSSSVTMNSTSFGSHASTISSSSNPPSMHSTILHNNGINNHSNNTKNSTATGESIINIINTDNNTANENTNANNSNSASSQSPAALATIQLRSQLAIFLRADEQEQLKRISSGVITIKHGKDPSKAIRGGLFSSTAGETGSKTIPSDVDDTNHEEGEEEELERTGGKKKNKSKRNKSHDSDEEDEHRHFHPRYYAGYGANSRDDDEEEEEENNDVEGASYSRAPRRRRYSSLMSQTEDFGEDLLTDSEEKLKLLWVVKQHHHHHQQRQQYSPVRESSRFYHSNNTSKQNSSGNLSKQHPFQQIVHSFDRRLGSAQRLVAQLTR